MQNIAENSAYEPWRTDALERGYQSSAAIPLVQGDTIYGVLNVYADRSDAFDDEERELLQELADDTGRALHRIESRERLQGYGRLVENLPIGVYRTTPEPNGAVIEANPALADMMNADSPEILEGRSVRTFHQNPSNWDAVSQELQQEGFVQGKELTLKTIDGEDIWASVTAMRTVEAGEVYFDGIIQDVTGRKERE